LNACLHFVSFLAKALIKSTGRTGRTGSTQKRQRETQGRDEASQFLLIFPRRSEPLTPLRRNHQNDPHFGSSFPILDCPCKRSSLAMSVSLQLSTVFSASLFVDSPLVGHVE
jgi:hypothetical protein